MAAPRSLDQNFFKEWSHEMAYVLGYFAADGCLISNSRGASYVEFTSCDRELLEIVRRAAGSGHSISTRPRRSDVWKQQYRLQIGSREWVSDLKGLGFTERKSHTLTFPDAPMDYIPDFIRGYFDGDGGVYFKMHWSKSHQKERWVFSSHFTSGSKEFLLDLHSKLKNLGVKGGSLVTKERGFCLSFSRHDSLALYKIMYNTAQVEGLFLSRKRQVFETAIETLDMRP